MTSDDSDDVMAWLAASTPEQILTEWANWSENVETAEVETTTHLQRLLGWYEAYSRIWLRVYPYFAMIGDLEERADRLRRFVLAQLEKQGWDNVRRCREGVSESPAED